ncbi:MAG TPA: hypothetical protein VN782_01545 [Usitatibacter sp.]|nr:hypothetical protein [Usitatibacter sp.]
MNEPRFLKNALAAIAALCIVASCGTMPPPRSDTVFAAIPTGATMDGVRQQLGKPDEEMAFPATRTVSWTYFYYDTWGFYAEEDLTFDTSGLLVGKFSKRVGYGGSGKT